MGAGRGLKVTRCQLRRAQKGLSRKSSENEGGSPGATGGSAELLVSGFQLQPPPTSQQTPPLTPALPGVLLALSHLTPS